MDTVILKVYGPKKFTFTKKDWFLPEIYSRKYAELTPTERTSNRHYLRRFRLEVPIKTKYNPQVDVLEVLDKEKKFVRYVMIVTFSIPKLLYGNSVQEVSDGDFDRVIETLQSKLQEVGIVIEGKYLREARVSAIHFCKNVILPNDIRLQDIIRELERVDISKAFDVTTKETKSGGRLLHIYSGITERVFYDKVADAIRPKNKRKDKGPIDYERTVIDEFDLQGTEIFRYEYRIKKTQTVERIINKALDRKGRTVVLFSDIFISGLSKAVLICSWQEMVGRPENQLALLGPTDKYRLLQHTFQQTKIQGQAHSMNKALISYGITNVIREHGAKEFRKLVYTHWNNEHPERLNKKIKDASELIKGLPYSNGIAFVDGQLERYELITRSLLKSKTV